ncbi:hypothetical protein ABT118_28345, partial [Kitasatospora sp. NPDC002040]
GVPVSPSGVREGPLSGVVPVGRVPVSLSGVREDCCDSGAERPSGDGVLASEPTRVPNGSSGALLRGSLVLGVGCCVERGVSFEPDVSRLGALSGDVLDEGLCPDGALPEGVLPDGVLPEGLLPDGVLPEGVLPEGLLPEGVLADGLLPLLDGELPEGVLAESLPPLLPGESEPLLPCPAALSNPLRA